MKVFHISFHLGCIRSMNGLLRDLGHSVDFLYARPEIPYSITESVADRLWETHKDTWNTYDLIITSDTVALSYIFLKHKEQLKPKLLIWICNRFSYAMEENNEFYELLKEVSSGTKYIDRIKLVPYTEYERIYCGEHNIWIREPVLLPYGNVIGTQEFNGQVGNESSKVQIDTSGVTKPKEETIFISMYGNDWRFLPLKNILLSNGYSVASGEFRTVEDLRGYKCIVTLPDAFSKFFFFELMNLPLPIFIPTEEFFMMLNRSYTQAEKGEVVTYAFTYRGNIVPNQFVDLCEWFKYPHSKTYFSSIEDLIAKLREFTSEKRAKVVQQMYRDVEFHKTQVKATFNKLVSDFFPQ
jgi:hypothetical protein